MKDQVKHMYDRITMPEETEQAVRRAMHRKATEEKKSGKSWLRRAAAVAAVAALILLISPQARAVVREWTVKYFFPGSDITIYEMTDEEGNVVGVAGVDTEASPFARIVNGRLYFVGNGEKIDITDMLSEEDPYIYTYVDDYGLTHAMAVGYSDSLENYGIYEFIWEETEEGKDWVTGTGRNFLNPETETRYPWVDLIWEKLDVPWPMPD